MSIPENFENETKYHPGFEVTEDEIYLIRTPKGFDISKLDGQRFSRHHVTEVGRDEGPCDLTTVYGSTFYKNDTTGLTPLLKTDDRFVSGRSVQGLVSITKSCELPPSFVQSSSKKSCQKAVPMPVGLKTRFTPFGAGNPVKVPSIKEVKSRKRTLDNSLDTSVSEKKRKKKRKKTSKESDNETSIIDDIADDNTVFITQKRFSNGFTEDMNHDSGINLEDSDKSHKKKKKKFSNKSCLLDESDLRENGEHNLTDSPPTVNNRKDKLSKSLFLDADSSLSDLLTGSTSKKKKKKKDKRGDLTLP